MKRVCVIHGSSLAFGVPCCDTLIVAALVKPAGEYFAPRSGAHARIRYASHSSRCERLTLAIAIPIRARMGLPSDPSATSLPPGPGMAGDAIDFRLRTAADAIFASRMPSRSGRACSASGTTRASRSDGRLDGYAPIIPSASRRALRVRRAGVVRAWRSESNGCNERRRGAGAARRRADAGRRRTLSAAGERTRRGRAGARATGAAERAHRKATGLEPAACVRADGRKASRGIEADRAMGCP